jgi:hypothetical protein
VAGHPALRALPAEQVAGLPVDLLGGGAPILDDVLPASVSDTFEAGEESDVPYLVDSNGLEFPDAFIGSEVEADGLRAKILGADRAAAVSDYWVSFADTGDPNHDGAPAWGETGPGRLMELTGNGPQMVEVDPWRQRLDAVEAGYDARS